MVWFFYQVIVGVSIPFVLIRLWFKNRKEPGYGERWWQRLGLGWPAYQVKGSEDKPYWLHAVSLGEAMAARPIIDDWLKQDAKHPILVTTTTLSGYQQIKQAYGDKVRHCFFPYDLACVMRRVVKRVQPACVVVMETELWWAWFRVLNQYHVPLILVNARLSKRSLRRYARFPSFSKPLFQCMDKVCAQTKFDARRFSVLMDGSSIEVMGNLKFDCPAVSVDQSITPPWGTRRPVWLIASTHAPEEERLLPLVSRLKQDLPDLLVCIAPRHPNRREEILSSIKSSGLTVAVRSREEAVEPDTSIYLLDTLGELADFYAFADVVFVGGSLIPHGGHNVLEPIAMGVPVVIGPYTFNFQSMVQSLLKQQGLVEVEDVEGLYRVTKDLFLRNDLSARQIQRASVYLNQHRGALKAFKIIFKKTVVS